MKSEAVNLLRFFQIGKQCLIPIYQRTYSWTEEQCDLLWNDIVRVGTSENIPNHFVGSFVYVQDNHSQVMSATPQCMVIDGQQRMTTISLLLLAVANAIQKTSNELKINDEFQVTQNYIKNNYLLNSNEEGERKFKLILTQSDKETYLSLLQGLPLPNDYSKRIVENYEFFEDKLSESNLADIYVGIQKLMIVEIALDRSTDNPQLIFESLNSTGLELSQADLIRNFILMGLEPKRQKRVYEEYWFPMERRFGHAEYSNYFDRFMRDYLTTRLGRIPNITDVHKEFKFISLLEPNIPIEEIVSDIFKYSEYFVNIALAKEPNELLKKNFESINQLKVDVVYPFLLEIYNDYKSATITINELIEILQMLESYVFRRAICSIPTNSMNKTFATMHKDIDKSNYLESFKAVLLLKDSYKRFPTDDEFIRDLKIKDVYNFRSKNYLLLKIENSKHSKESVNIGNLSIEHIMPQNENLASEWISDLGEDWKEIQSEYLHTLGNLTLTGYNSEMSDKPFKKKQEISGGFKDSPLFLNNALKDIQIWNKDEIINRANNLANISANIWNYPQLDKLVIENYKKVKTERKVVSDYKFSDYKHMNDSRLDLYKSIREKILMLGSDVSEHFTKLYIAYKSIDDSNFVCIVPQKSRLRVTLSIKYENLFDPSSITIDADGKGYWGGDQCTVFGISNLKEIDYAMSLIKQSYDDSLLD